MTKANDSSLAFNITKLHNHSGDYRVTLATEVRKLFKPYGWTGSRPEKWGYLADPTGFHSESLPLTLVARVGEQVVGSASFVRRDYDALDCGPWLAGLVVHPDFRKMGVASHLIKSIERHAAVLFAGNHPDVAEGKMFLNAERTINDWDSVDMYTRDGWTFLTEEDAHKQTDIIMWKSIA